MRRKIGILCASDSELEPFLPLLTDITVSESAMLKVYDGRLDGMPAAALYSGVCKVNAAVATQVLLDRYGAEVVVNAGTCGGMSPEVGLFDTVVATETAYHDVAEEILTEFHPWMPSVWFPSDRGLLEAARAVAGRRGNMRFGRIVTGELFVEQERRQSICERFAPLAVDMESAAVAHVCYVNRIPFLSVRTVTDTEEAAGEAVFERNCARASELSRDVVRELLCEWAKAGG